MRVHRILFLLAIAQFGIPHAAVQAAQQSPAFTYQGVLRQSNAPVNDSVDLQFTLFDAANAGAQIGATLAANAVMVSDGVFTASLDFGALAINGEERWLEIAVRAPAGSANPFVTLAPRQKLASTPYAAFALQSALSGTYGDSVNFSNNANLFAGSFSGSGAGLTNINPANFTSGTAGISITGNAATATTSGNVTGIVAVANGGTGANNAVTARTNLGAAAAAHAHAAADIASGNLSVARLPTGGAWSLASNLNVDANSLVVDQANNRVGIGTSAPERPLHVVGSALIEDAVILDANINPLLIGSDGSFTAFNAVPFTFKTGTTAGAASTRMVIQTNGDIAIGTTAAEAKVHVVDGAAITVTPSGGSTLILERNDHNYLSILAPDASETAVLFGNPTNGGAAGGVVFNTPGNPNGLQFRTNTNDTRMSITNGGSVGIGTGSPEAALHVLDGSAGTITAATGSSLVLERNGANYLSLLATAAQESGIYFGNPLFGATAGGMIFNAPSGANGLQFRTAGNNTRMSITGGGLVGIGTTTPAAPLHVVGDAIVTDTLQFDSFSCEINNKESIAFRTNTAGSNLSWYRFWNDGTEQLRIEDGNEAAIRGDGSFVSNGIDYAEGFKATHPDLEPGDIVSLTVGQWEYCSRTAGAFDAHMIGIVSTQPGFVCGMSFDAEDQVDPALAAARSAARAAGDDRAERELSRQLAQKVREVYRPIALSGRVPCNVDASYGPIRAGDRLTSSPTPGHAMVLARPGPSIGIALENFAGGTGSIMVLVQPGWHGGAATAGEVDDAPAVHDEIAHLRAQIDGLQLVVRQLLAAQNQPPHP